MVSKRSSLLWAVCLILTLFPAAAIASDIFERLRSVTLQPIDETALPSAVVAPDGAHAYFGTTVWPTRIVKVDLLNLQRVGSLVIGSTDNPITTAMISPDGRYGYFGSDTPNGTLTRVDLETFTTAGSVSLPGLGGVLSGVMSPDGNHAYIGTSSSPAHVVMIDLVSMQVVESLAMQEGINRLSSAAITPDGKHAFFGTETSPASIVRVELTTLKEYDAFTAKGGEMVLRTAVMSPNEPFVYFASGDSPSRILKVGVERFEQMDTLLLQEGPGPGFPGEDMVRSSAITPDGRFAYFGTHTVTARVVKVDLEKFERVGALTLPNDEAFLRSGDVSPDGSRVYFGTGGSPGRVVEIRVDQILPEEARAIGDLDNNGCLDFRDFVLVLELWGFFIDGTPIGFQEFLALLEHWRARGC